MTHAGILTLPGPSPDPALAAALAARPLFVCVAAYTATVRIPGLSAAGASPALRELTATADVEAVVTGRPVCMRRVPGNPAGAPGPVLITMAALALGNIPALCVDAGLNVPAQCAVIRLGAAPGADITTGRAVDDAAALFQAGLELGERLARECTGLIVAETVPGGTTTAQALLAALGIATAGRVSSSFAVPDAALKARVVDQALRAAGIAPGGLAGDPLAAVERLGDPMQPVAAGLAAAASRRIPVLLAGGTQMAAVLALLSALSRTGGVQFQLNRLAIGATRWVAADPAADLAGLARDAGPTPALAADLDFSAAAWSGLRDYERGHVKEGVGAGGAAIAAFHRGVTPAQLAQAVDDLCVELAPRLEVQDGTAEDAEDAEDR